MMKMMVIFSSGCLFQGILMMLRKRLSLVQRTTTKKVAAFNNKEETSFYNMRFDTQVF
jgi:competence protein ComGF